MRPADLARLRVPGQPTISPDGRHVVYRLERIDLDDDAYRSDLWMLPADGSGTPRRLTRGPRDTAPRFSPDGRWLAFLRGADDEPPQLHVMPTDLGEARPVCRHPLGVGQYAWDPGARRIAYIARVPEEGRYGTDEDVPAGKEPARRITTRRRRLDGVGWTIDRRPHVFCVDVTADEAEPVQVTEGDFDHADPTWSPDGTRLAFVSARHETRDEDLASDVWIVDATAIGDRPPPEPRRVTDAGSTVFDPAFTPDGATVLFRGHGVPSDVLGRNVGVFAVPADGASAPRRITDEETWEAVDRFVPGPADLATDGDAVLTLVQHRGAVELRRFPLSGGDGDVVVGGRLQVRGYEVAGGAVAAVVADATSAGDVVVAAGDEQRRLTRYAEETELSLRDMVEVKTTADDGYPVHGWLVKPDPGAHAPPYPVLLNVHGGPFTQYGWVLFDEPQVYAGAGYAVVMGNPRGSSGYGQAHGRAIVGAAGDRDEADLLALLDAALADCELDGDRVGVMGGSYGGFMTTRLMSRHDRFRAGISERALNSLDSFAGSSDIGAHFPEALAGPDPASQLEQSPLTHADKITRPMLLVHAEEDWRCPLEQAERLFILLKRNGVETEMLVFPGEGHELSRSGLPSHRLQRFEAILDWWARHLA